jgi:hypothetical protein
MSKGSSQNFSSRLANLDALFGDTLLLVAKNSSNSRKIGRFLLIKIELPAEKLAYSVVLQSL